MAQAKSAIVGLGSPIRSDDAVGLIVAGRVHERLGKDACVDLIEASVGGFELVELLEGYDRAVIVDAIQTEGGRPGDCYPIDPAQLEPGAVPSLSHQVGLLEGLELSRRLGMKTPGYVRIYAIEVADISTVGTELTAQVKAAVPRIVSDVAAREFGITPP